MAIRQHLESLAAALLMLTLAGTVGCNHHAYPNPYAPPAYGNPWASPGTSAPPPTTALPPPPGQQSPVPAYPTTPTLPPAQGTTGISPVPGAAAGIQGPNWNNPGSLAQQQQRANVFDPFANNEVGPEIVGGRPRDFQKPMTEATRAP